MSDTEESKPGASSALLNIASAYSDSDSSQDNNEDYKPQKSLGSLVENLRAEAKKSESEAVAPEIQVRSAPPAEPEKTHSVTKIVRLDSGKIVKISTSPSSKSSESRNEEAQSRTPADHVRAADSETADERVLNQKPVNTITNQTANAASVAEASIVQSVVNQNSAPVFSVTTDKSNVRDENDQHLGRVTDNTGDIEVLIPENNMGVINSKKEVRAEVEDITVDTVAPEVSAEEVAESKSPDVIEIDDNSSQNPDPSDKLSESVTSSECNDKNVTSNLDRVHNVTSVEDAPKEQSSKFELKTESNILNAYLKSKLEKKVISDTHRTDGEVLRFSSDVKNLETVRNQESVFQGSDYSRGAVENSATAGSVASPDPDIIIEKEITHKKPAENVSDSFKPSLLDIKPRPELKPLPRLDRIRVKSPVAEGTGKKTESELQASSPALYKMLESCESYQSTPPEVKRPGPGPIKLKRNFSCISTVVTDPEKKFRPEPSDAARPAPSEAPISPSKPEVASPQDSVKSPPRMQITSPTRSLLSPTFQQTSPPQQSFQASFSNMINSSQSQVPTFQPLKKSPQPAAAQQPQRVSARQEQKRTLPLILRKADISGSKAKEPKIEDTAAAPPKKVEVNSPKVTSEADTSIETISSESQEQSASVPFSNSSSNGTGVDFDNIIGSSVVNKDAKVTTLSEELGSDNARPAPTKDEDPEQPTTFISEPPPAETPAIVIPKKRGRPRKFPLPEPAPVAPTWPTPEKNGTPKSSSKSSKRKKSMKKFKTEAERIEEEKRRHALAARFKKKKKPDGAEPEAPRCFNKKGRMEVMTEGCKPVTVNQITEYFWPPISSLPPGEKPEGLMIQEQISEYLGVKSFKRKYPSIKRRPVDMEERNYLQENGYVSENMCDMGLTAVFSADIMEIMYNDFPAKFEEYRRYTREKKLKEQKALREKQAAENMDPRKEALESIVSWNSEFNKTRQ
ncbi:UNVERIFIED_CONTAM: hypothetical protein PYX00_002096 [Menopon gallinae]